MKFRTTPRTPQTSPTLGSKLLYWRGGVRLYIGLGIALVTMQVFAFTRAAYGATDLGLLRLEEIYAWIGLIMVTLAISIGPAFKLFPSLPNKRQWFEARRLIGIGGAWFAALHTAIAYQHIFHGSNPLNLSPIYQQSLTLGLVALVILAAMAITSFNAAMKRMGIWWFRLHRLVYVALVAVLVHAFMIGAHATQPIVLTILGVVAAALLFAHIKMMAAKPPLTTLRIVAITVASLTLLAAFNYGIGQHVGYNPLIRANGEGHDH